MSDIDARFAQAQTDATALPSKPGNDVLLKLYSLYKQASSGDCTGDRPGMMDIAGRAKYDAWKKLAGKTNDEAKEEYVATVEGLKG